MAGRTVETKAPIQRAHAVPEADDAGPAQWISTADPVVADLDRQSHALALDRHLRAAGAGAARDVRQRFGATT